MRSTTFLLQDIFDEPLSKKQFQEAKQEYLKKMKFKILPVLPHDIYNLIEVAKRKRYSIGAYQNLTLFETLNRTASDLVVLAAGDFLYKDKNIKTIKFNLSNKPGYDLIIKYADDSFSCGEAFNTTPGFGHSKFKNTIKHFTDKKMKLYNGRKIKCKLNYIFINEEMSTCSKANNVKSKSEKENKNIKIHFINTNKFLTQKYN